MGNETLTTPSPGVTSQTTPPAQTPPATPPSSSTSPAVGPGLSPPASPAAGDKVGGAPPAEIPPASTTPPASPGQTVVPAPTEYKLPQGAPAEVGVWANKHGLTQEQLDAAIGMHTNLSESGKLAMQQSMLDQGKAHVASWGDKAPENKRLAKTALAQMDEGGKLTTVLRETGYINHPAVMDFLVHLGRNLQEGGFLKSIPAIPTGNVPKTAAQAMFGNNHPSKQ